MIRTFDICINAAHPEVKLYEAATFIGSPSTAFVRGVPPAMGEWKITAVRLAAAWPDGSIENVTATQTGDGVWTATLQGTDTSGRAENGLQILADGVDETGTAVTGYVLGIADLAVYTRDATIDVDGQSWYVRLFDSAPTPPHKGDAYISSGYLLIYDGAQWITIGGGGGGGIVDDTVTRTSTNAVKSSGIWSAIWGTLTALPTGFSALYDWVVDQLTGKLDTEASSYEFLQRPNGLTVDANGEEYEFSRNGVTPSDSTVARMSDIPAIPTVPSASTSTPLADGTASAGSSAAYARGDHRHPTDNTRAAASDLTALAQTVAGKLSAAGATRSVTAEDSGGTETYKFAGTGETTDANAVVRVSGLPYVNVGEAAQMLAGVYGVLSRGVQRHTATSGETSATFGFADTPGTGKIADALLDIDNSGNTSTLGMEFSGLGTTFTLVAPDGDDLAEMTSVDGGKQARFYFTETALVSNNLPVISLQRITLGAVARGS